MGTASPCHESGVVIVGGGPSGATCAETLRSEGFKGRVTLVCKEPYLPYDRVKVSKLGTEFDIEKIQARTEEYYQNANIDVLKGVEVTKVISETQTVELSNGSKLPYSSLFIATGCKPRVPDVPGIDLKNIFTVRDYDEGISIARTLGSEKDKDVVVLGLSYIGLESASSSLSKAKSMTIVGRGTLPLGQMFPAEIGQSLRKLFEDNGVKFCFETTISKCNGDNGVIKSVELTNGKTLPADVLILGVGSTFYTEFLKDSNIDQNPDGTVIVNDKLQTNIKNIFAGGDIAYAPVYAAGNTSMDIGHIGLAQYHGLVAAKNILNKDVTLKSVPYFWTMIFGKSIRFAGCGKSSSFQIEGDVKELKFVIFFFNESDKVISVASCMRDPVVSQFAELLYQGKSLYKNDLKDDPFAWTKNIN